MTPNIAIVNKTEPVFLSYLGAEELAKYQVLSERSKKDFLAGRVALKVALSNYLKAGRVSSVVIKNLINGQPYIEGRENIYCSIGHSHGRGIGAIAPFQIGADIEIVKPHHKSLLSYIADSNESRVVENFFSESTDIVTLIWVIKEAIMKGLGTGFEISPHQVKVRQKINQEYFEVAVNNLGPQTWYVWPFQKDDFYVSVAYENNYKRKPHINWDCYACL